MANPTPNPNTLPTGPTTNPNPETHDVPPPQTPPSVPVTDPTPVQPKSTPLI